MGITCKQTGKIRGIMRKIDNENEANKKRKITANQRKKKRISM